MAAIIMRLIWRLTRWTRNVLFTCEKTSWPPQVTKMNFFQTLGIFTFLYFLFLAVKIKFPTTLHNTFHFYANQNLKLHWRSLLWSLTDPIRWPSRTSPPFKTFTTTKYYEHLLKFLLKKQKLLTKKRVQFIEKEKELWIIKQKQND